MPDLSNITPAVEDVADLLRSRTEVDEGSGTRTFTEDTIPDRALVETKIASAVGELDDAVGVDVPERYRDKARDLAAVRAAGQLLLTLDDPSVEDSKQQASYTAQWLQGLPDFVSWARGAQWVDIS